VPDKVAELLSLQVIGGESTIVAGRNESLSIRRKGVGQVLIAIGRSALDRGDQFTAELEVES
jgi:hypothetical protein